MKQLVKIIIPFYKETLNSWENAALANNMENWRPTRLCFLLPRN